MTATRTLSDDAILMPLLSDEPDQKLNGEGLGLMAMSPAVRFGLNLLRVYLFAMMLMLAYHVLDLAGTFGHGAAR